jgi:hypothetical protein
MLPTHRARIAWLIALALLLTAPTLVSAKGGRGGKVKEPPALCHSGVDKKGNPTLKGVKPKDIAKHQDANGNLPGHEADIPTFEICRDRDKDALGDPNDCKQECKIKKGFVDNGADCDDTIAGAQCQVTCPCDYDKIPKTSAAWVETSKTASLASEDCILAGSGNEDSIASVFNAKGQELGCRVRGQGIELESSATPMTPAEYNACAVALDIYADAVAGLGVSISNVTDRCPKL